MKSIPLIPFSPPKIYDELIDEVVATLRSGWITTGPRTKQFEQELTEFCGCKKTLCVGSATQGMELMLRWFGVGPGDEVIVPAYTYCATANVVVHCGAKPVMVDVGPDFNIDVEKIRQAITPRTKVIIPVDIAGYPSDYEAINVLVRTPEIQEQFSPNGPIQEQLGRILVLSDAAHSLGATANGQPAGSLTDVTCFSFHAVKNLTTAEGGAICLNLSDFDCDEIYKQLNVSSLHGQTKDALAKTQGTGWRYDVVEAGYKCNMTDIQAAMGLVELRRYRRETLDRRKEIFDLYGSGFGQHSWAIIPPSNTGGRETSYHVYALRINHCNEDQRDRIMELIKEKGVSVNVHFQPLPLLTFYKQLGYDIDDFPGAFNQYANEISLPVYFDLTNEQVATVIEAVATSVDEVLNA